MITGKKKSWYERVPKVELHLHLTGAIPHETLWEMIKKYGGDQSLLPLADEELDGALGMTAALAETWLQQAEYALVEQRELTGWLAQAVGSEQFEELSPSPPAVSCRADSWIHVYRRVK